MDKVERVALALALATDKFRMKYHVPYYKWIAQAAIDAMQPDIAEADRKARDECAGICDDEEPYMYSAYIAADKIRETIK